MTYLFANLELFEKGIESARSVTSSWDKVWNDTLLGGSYGGTFLYGTLCSLGVLAAVGTLLFLGVKLFKDLNEGNYLVLDQVIWPLLLTMFLSNNGVLLASATMEARDVINRTNDIVLETTYAGARLDDLFRQAQGIGAAKGAIQGYVQQCESLLGEKQVQCLNKAIEQSRSLLDSYRDAFGGTWVDEIGKNLDAIGDAISANPASILDPTKNPIYWGLVGPAWEQVVYGILWAWQMAFQTGVEASMLLTALLAPLAFGASLLPYGPKPIFAWLISLLSVGLLKLSFNIIAGLSAAMFVSASRTDPLFFPIFLGVFAPLLAGALSAGAGLAVWSSITNAARSTVAPLTRIPS